MLIADVHDKHPPLRGAVEAHVGDAARVLGRQDLRAVARVRQGESCHVIDTSLTPALSSRYSKSYAANAGAAAATPTARKNLARPSSQRLRVAVEVQSVIRGNTARRALVAAADPAPAPAAAGPPPSFNPHSTLIQPAAAGPPPAPNSSGDALNEG